jgi:hypothetical protein
MSKYDVFIASPISGWAEDAETALGLALATSLSDSLKEAGFSVHFVGDKFTQGPAGRVPDFSLNLAMIESSASLVVVTGHKGVCPSSIWGEAGIALALRIPVVFISPGVGSLPTLVQRALAPVPEGGQPHALGIWFERRDSLPSISQVLLPTVLVHLDAVLARSRNIQKNIRRRRNLPRPRSVGDQK